MKHFKEERTFVMIKPDGVQRSLIGEIIARFERVGLKIVAMKMVQPTEDHVEKHYLLDPGWKMSVGQKSINAYKDKGIKSPFEDPIKAADSVLFKLKKYITSSPVVAIVVEGAYSVQIVRKIVGGTEPLTSDIGTIRGDYVIDSYQMGDVDDRATRNLIHASGSVDEANAEIDLWFDKNEIQKYSIVQERILYDVNIDGKLE